MYINSVKCSNIFQKKCIRKRISGHLILNLKIRFETNIFIVLLYFYN